MSFKTNLLNCSALAAVGLIPATCWSAVFWDETTQGDLSGDRSAPTSLTLSLGGNILFATTQGGDLEFQVTPVPEPKSASVCAVALLVAAWVIRRRRRRFEVG